MRTFITILLFFTVTNAFAQKKNAPLEISHLTGDFYIYITHQDIDGSPYPANGMYMVTDEGAVIFDTPWDSTQYQPLLDTIWARHHKKVIMSIATHWHEDRTRGFDYYNQQGIRTYATTQTDELCKEHHKARAKYLINNDTTFTIGGHTFQTYYGGEGHTSDNIVIWFGKEKILYGGCLIKSTEAQNLGNLEDANVKAWAATIKKIQAKFGKPNFIIPGHQSWKSKNSLNYTLKLVEEYNRKHK
ncbi:BlaB/IND/MUS family subclass B1 metallo-beta-lactamase [Taibaiella lutea]|uniref:beta-lactamase n=1 Tax=Taibaiella lutea TaxID=2608001 RepID=A0A5M6CND7_9BACT|nr:BlaB/IND/MUS family subclass B1 metallo-beta-lactamase [Taibaiella lutea]KAA5536721.1 BlaB/IND/MUS family subclass B1 metallo-beta-lactamase [Taibaiella lutea]